MTNTTTRRQRATEKAATLFAAAAGARIDLVHGVSVVGDDLVVGGDVAEMQKIRTWAHSVGAQCAIDPTIPDDPDFADWTCARLPLAALERALQAAQRAVRT